MSLLDYWIECREQVQNGETIFYCSSLHHCFCEYKPYFSASYKSPKKGQNESWDSFWP